MIYVPVNIFSHVGVLLKVQHSPSGKSQTTYSWGPRGGSQYPISL